MMSHMSACVADVLGQAVVRPAHRDGGAAALAAPAVAAVLVGARASMPPFDFAHAAEVFVELDASELLTWLFQRRR